MGDSEERRMPFGDDAIPDFVTGCAADSEELLSVPEGKLLVPEDWLLERLLVPDVIGEPLLVVLLLLVVYSI